MPDDPSQPPEPSLLERAENWTAQMADEGRPPEGPQRDSYDRQMGFLKGAYGFTKSTISGLIDVAIFAVKVYQGDPATQQKIGDAAIWFAKSQWIAFFGTEEQKEAQDKAAADWVSGMFNATRDKLNKDWEKAKKDGKENELIAEWATRGILEVASLFVGIGEVKGAEAASDLSKVGNVLDKVKVACPLEEAALAEKLAAAAAKRAAAIKDSGMVAEHAEAISKVAQERKEVIIFQSVNKEATEKIAEGAVPKPMAIKAKSANKGAAKGYIPVNQALSKAADTNEVGKYNKIVDQAIKDHDAVVVMVKTEDGEVAVLADPETKMPFTSDYDLLSIGREGQPSDTLIMTEDQGILAPEDRGTIEDINEAVGNEGGDVVQHGAAANAPKPQPINYPLTAMDPDGDIVSLENQQQLQDFLSAKQAQGYNFALDPGWGLQ